MGQITENFVLDMLTACERQEHPPFTVWEAKQLLHAWREREALRKAALPEVQWLVSDWNKTYLVRGHVEPPLMLAAVRAHGEESPETFSTPTHAWWRTFPKWQDGERVQWFQHAEPNARGAFKCTVMTKDW